MSKWKKRYMQIITCVILCSMLFGKLPVMQTNAASTALEEDFSNLEVFSIDDVKGNLHLPSKGDKGSSITWESENPAIITDEKDGSKEAGVVDRTQINSETKVKLTATLTLGSENLKKEFTATVKPIDPNLDTDYTAGYLWSYFNETNLQPSGSTGTSGVGRNKIFYGYSQDGLHWNTINNKNGTQYPVAESVVGDKGVRDPHVIRSYDGDKYWILGTDLQGNWSQSNGSQNIIVWESDDLVNWTESRAELIWENAGCVWAPEAMYDEESGDYLVYWASRDQRDGAVALRMYISRTRDFHTFTEPELWADEYEYGQPEKNVIDSTIAVVNDRYYRFSTSDWHTVVDWCDTLSTDINDWERIVYRGTYGDYGFDYMEGLTSYQLPDGRWCIMGDNSAYRGFVIDEEDFHSMMVTKLSSASTTSSMSNSFDKTFRHGTVMRLSAAEEQRILEAYSNGYDSTPRYSVGVKNGTSDPFVTTEGKTVTVTANNMPKGQVFSYWEAEGYELTEEQKASVSFSFVMPAGDVKFTAVGEDYEIPGRPASDEDGLFYSEDFENYRPTSGLTLHGTASVTGESQEKVLYLDGVKNNEPYASLPEGWLDGMDQLTLSMDVKTDVASGNFFTLAIGHSDQKYIFLRTRDTQFSSHITLNGWQNESYCDADLSSSTQGKWKNVTLVMDDYKLTLYVDGMIAAENTNTGIKLSDLGAGASIWFGRSFYSADNYFKGSFDNIKMYDRALSEFEVAELYGDVNLVTGGTVGTLQAQPSTGLDEHTAVFTWVDNDNKSINSYVKKYQYNIENNTAEPTDLSSLPVTLNFPADGIKALLDGETFINGSTVDMTRSHEVSLSYGDYEQVWTLEIPSIATNSVLPGKFADPDIDKFGDKYWIFPTTDGYDSWSGTEFHAFSSDSLNGPWIDEGVILNVNKNTSSYKNIKGVDVAVSPWSTGNAWAPCIEEKDGVYYFYYCANQSVGVAWSDNPAGPYTVLEEALINHDVLNKARQEYGVTITVGQNIDPDVITLSDGRSFLYWGNGNGGASVVELNEDMISLKLETMQNVILTTGNTLTGFRESITVQEYEGKYHFFWSQDDTGSPNYKVQYGVSDSPTGPVEYKYVLIELNSEKGMLGTAHQSTLLDDDGKVYLAYHRFYTPLGQQVGGLGYNRETCINRIPYDKENGVFMAIQPTYEGVDGQIVLADGNIYEEDDAEIATEEDKYFLKLTIDYAVELKDKYPEYLIEEVKTRFENALEYAQNIYIKEKALQSEVYEADEALINMIHYLSFTANYERVESAVNDAYETINSGLYEEDTAMDTYKSIVNELEEMLLYKNVTDTEINAKLTELADAFGNLNDKQDPGEVDVSRLQREVNKAKSFYENIDIFYDDDARAAFKAAYEYALEIIANKDSYTQVQIDQAAIDLHNTMLALRIIPSKDALAALLTEGYDIDSSLYTEESYNVLAEALAYGQIIFNKADATAAEIEEACELIKSAIIQLDPITEGPAPVKPDKTELKALLDYVKALKKAEYTEDSFAKIVEAVAYAWPVYLDDEASAEEVAKAVALLKDAIANLVKADVTPPGQTEDTDEPGQSDTGETDGKGKDGKGKDGKGSGAKTGDTAAAATVFSMLAVSLFVFIVFMRKKKRA